VFIGKKNKNSLFEHSQTDAHSNFYTKITLVHNLRQKSKNYKKEFSFYFIMKRGFLDIFIREKDFKRNLKDKLGP